MLIQRGSGINLHGKIQNIVRHALRTPVVVKAFQVRVIDRELYHRKRPAKRRDIKITARAKAVILEHAAEGLGELFL